MESETNNENYSLRLFRNSLEESLNKYNETQGLVGSPNCNETKCEIDLEEQSKYCKKLGDDSYDKLNLPVEITTCKFCKELFDYNTIDEHIRKCGNKTYAFGRESSSVIDFESSEDL